MDNFVVTEPKTKAFVKLVAESTPEAKVLIVGTAFDETTYLAARNVQPTLLVKASDVNTEQLLAFKKIILTNDALATLAGKDEEMKEIFDVIDTVRLTEKGSLLTEKHNKYVFRVNPNANKVQIKQAIEKLFGKKVADVNTCNYAGKLKRTRGPLGRKPLGKKPLSRSRRARKSTSHNLWRSKLIAHSRRSSALKQTPAFDEITKSKPEKSLVQTLKKTAAAGTITVV